MLLARIGTLAPAALRATVRTRARALVRVADRTEVPLGALRAAPVLAWAGIGNPAAFAAQLADLGARVVGTRFERDHHVFRASDVAAAMRSAGTMSDSDIPPSDRHGHDWSAQFPPM